MSLENTLREMLNEMKMPESKPPLDPTVHTGPRMEKPPLPSTVHSGPKKPPVTSNPMTKPSEITRRVPKNPQHGLQEGTHRTLKEYYKQTLDEKLDRSGVAGTPAQRLTAAGRAAGAPESLVGLATAQARKKGTPETITDEGNRKHYERKRAREKWAGITPREQQATRDTTRLLGLPLDAAHLMAKKDEAAFEDNLSRRTHGGRFISRRERGLEAERRTGYIAARQRASRARKAEFTGMSGYRLR